MRKLLVAIDEQQTQVNAFVSVQETVDRNAAKKFIKEVEAWEADNSLENPYLVPRTGKCLLCGKTKVAESGLHLAGLSEAEVRAQLRQEESRAAREGCTVMHESSAAGFIISALQIENIQ